MNHIERMEVELKELKEKIKNGFDFLSKECKEPMLTDETQRQGLVVQIAFMRNYADILEERINYDKEKINSIF